MQAGDDVFHEAVAEIIVLLIGAQIQERQHRDRGLIGQRQLRRQLFRRRRLSLRHRRRLGRDADLQRVNPDRLGDVLELGFAEIADCEIEPRSHLTIGVFRKTDGARLGNPFQSRGDIDPVAHQVSIALLDHIAEMDADAELDAALGRKAGVALDHAVLHLDGAAHGVDHTAELNEIPVAGALYHAPVMHGHCRIDQIASERAQPRQCAILVHAGKPAVSDHIGCENCSELPGLGHKVLSPQSMARRRVCAFHFPIKAPELCVFRFQPADLMKDAHLIRRA